MFGALGQNRTDDIDHTKIAFYHWITRALCLVVTPGIEPGTDSLWRRCLTIQLCHHKFVLDIFNHRMQPFMHRKPSISLDSLSVPPLVGRGICARVIVLLPSAMFGSPLGYDPRTSTWARDNYSVNSGSLIISPVIMFNTCQSPVLGILANASFSVAKGVSDFFGRYVTTP